MNEHRHVFPDMDRMLIEAAETSGSLNDSFKMLSQWHEFMHRITRRIQVGLIYPMFMLHIGALVYGVASMFMDNLTLSGCLMLVVRILLLFYVPAAAIVLLLRFQDRVPNIRVPFDFLVLKVPLLGKGIYQLSICRYAKAFGMLYKAGVPITEATERATRATGNEIVAARFQGGIASVRQGGMAWEGFSRRLPNEYLQLWQIGEESGELDKTVDKIAEIAADRADLRLKEFAFWLPVFIWAVMATVLIIMFFKLFYKAYGPVLDFTF
jgi:type II secretory pathway component PulF